MSLLGKRVRDIVTGFTGIATGEHHYLWGCTRYTVVPEVGESNELKSEKYFDEPQLIEIDNPSIKWADSTVNKSVANGGPFDVPSERSIGV